ncbi:autotransporter outer membrane beta-barrel domain-containing protein [Psychrilyobacter atlanticus]|uniref:autotransporter family protein n=1 Tax=Psychrilyobacter atlanticus TaxID=271091 RepID=UPI0004072791|nr:autotransporter outer membrane beta-barrel domain-containing protein [Psychrilyobacter atlanticus]
MKKILLLFISLHSLTYTVNYFDAGISYTGGYGIQGQITSKITADQGHNYTYSWQAAGDSKNYIWDGVRFSQDSDGNLSLDSDISYTASYREKHWQNILFDNTSTGNRRNVELNNDSILNGNKQRELKTQNLILKDTNFEINGSKLFFYDYTKNSLTLENSNLSIGTGQLLVMSTSDFDIISKSGNNRLTAINDRISAKVNLDIQSGSELEFYYSGSISFGDKPVTIGSSAKGTIDNAKLKLTYSNIKFISNPDEFVFENNSTLELHGSDTKLEITNSTFKDSHILLGNNTQFKGDKLKLEDSNININDGAKIFLGELIVNGTSEIDGSHAPNTLLKTRVLTLNQSSVLNTKNIKKISTDLVHMTGSNNILNIDHDYLYVNRGFLIEDGTINIKDGSFLMYSGGYQNSDMKLELNIESNGGFFIEKYGSFYLNNTSGTDNNYTTLTNNGLIFIEDTFGGSGTILGIGDIYMKSGSGLDPKYTSGSELGNLKVNNGLIFEGGTYYSDIDLDSSKNELSDKIFYVDKNVDISKGLSIKTIYKGAPGRSALDFHDKEFTLVQSDTASSSGDIIGDYNNISVINSPYLPALLDFEVSDEQTNGNKDITLTGKVQGVHTLATHSNLGKNPNAKQVVTILPSTTPGVNPVLSPGAQKLQTALLTITNAQVSQNLNSLHAEPYSSHLTVGLEQNDLFLNMAMDHARSRGSVYSIDSEEISPENNIWIDTAYVEGKVNGENNLGNFKYSLSNFILGGDIYREDQLTLGVYTGYGKHKIREHDMVDQNFETDTYHFGSYGSYIYNDWIFTGMLGYSYGYNQSERDITVGTESGTSKDKFDSHSIYTGIRGAYPMKITKNTTLTPNLGLSYSYLYQEEIVESGFDMADLRVESASADSFITSAGLNLSYDGSVKSLLVRPMAFVKYEYDWSAAKDSSHDIRAGFVHTPDSMTTFSGQNRGKNLILFGVGIEVEITPVFLVGGGVTYSDDSNGEETGIGFNFEYLW